MNVVQDVHAISLGNLGKIEENNNGSEDENAEYEGLNQIHVHKIETELSKPKLLSGDDTPGSSIANPSPSPPYHKRSSHMGSRSHFSEKDASAVFGTLVINENAYDGMDEYDVRQMTHVMKNIPRVEKYEVTESPFGLKGRQQ